MDVPTRAVYSLHGSKAGLIRALAARGYRLLTDRVASLPATDDHAADLVNAGLIGFRHFALTRPHLFRLTFERVPTEVVTNPQAAEGSLAGGELCREPPPVGSGFWRPVHGIDSEKLWRGALTALVAGLAPAE